MTTRPRIAVDTGTVSGAQVRTWLLELGADPVDAAEPAASGLAMAPQHPGVTRAEVAQVVHGLRGTDRSRAERFDDHGSAESWPRGSY